MGVTTEATLSGWFEVAIPFVVKRILFGLKSRLAVTARRDELGKLELGFFLTIVDG
ncbi:hypothetical protein [Haloferax litoreum]